MYSFKGGAGRTVSTANVALILARELGRRVVLLDIDVESAGSSVLFGLDERVRQGSCWSIQDVLRGYAIGSNDEGETRQRESIEVNRTDFESNLWPKMQSTVWAGKDAYLKVLPSQIILRSEHELKVSYPEGQKKFEHLLMKIDGLQDSPDLVMYDSASGQQATAMFGLMNSHILVVFVRWSRQFIIGTTQFLKRYICQERFCRRIKQVFIVPTAVPVGRPQGRLGAELARREEHFREDITLVNGTAVRDFGVAPGWIQLLEPIHECEALKWDDRVFLLEDDNFQKEPGISELMQDYRQLAETLAAALHAEGRPERKSRGK